MAKRHEILLGVLAAVRERKDVVYLLGGRQPTLLLALLAQRVRPDVAVADALPASPIAFVAGGIALVMIVVLVHDALMLGAVLLTHGEPAAAGIGTGTFRFHWHRVHLPSGQKKSPAGSLLQGFILFFYFTLYRCSILIFTNITYHLSGGTRKLSYAFSRIR